MRPVHVPVDGKISHRRFSEVTRSDRNGPREENMGMYFYTFAGAGAAALLLTPVSMRFARLLGIVDRPNARKVHFRPTPRAGGVAIVAAMAVAVIPALIHLASQPKASGFDQIWIALAACAGVFLMGLFDDVVTVKRSQYKLLALIAATAAVCAAGFKLDEISLGHGPIPLGSFSIPLTFLWIVGVTTAVNFIDGLDGLAAGISAVTAGTIALVAGHSGANSDPAVTIIALGLLGSLCGFLVFNFNPAKVFMGDCGSMFLGFTLSTVSLMCFKRTTMTAGFTLPALALGIPILDTALTMVRRGMLQRRSLFSAERGHVHHRLMDLGVGHRDAVMILYAVTFACAGVGTAAWFSHSPVGRTIFASVHPVILFTFFAIVGSLRVSDIVTAFHRNRDIGKLTTQYRHTFDEMQLKFLAARSFDAWWTEVCEALHRLDFVTLSLQLTNRDGTVRTLNWNREHREASAPTLNVSVPIRQRRAGGPLRAEVEVSAEDSLELAGRRVTVFARLMEENSLASLPELRKGTGGNPKWSFSGLSSVPRMDSMIKPGIKIAIVHDFLYTYAGAERVLEQMLHVFPEAALFSLFDFLPPEKRGFLQGRPVTSSFIQRMPMAKSKHRHYLALMPLAIEQLDVSKYDMVISSSYVAAKGILTRPDQLHICYCHTPVRFAWDLQHQYLLETGLQSGLKSILARTVLHYIRNWDIRSANGVDVFLTNSDFVARRIEKFYRRRSTTLYPPVDVDSFKLQIEKGDYYVTASRMVPYKRIDLVAEAFTSMPDKRLIIVGEGPDFEKIKAKAGPNVKMVGHQSFERLVEYMRHAKAFVFAAEEDFGIVPVEAQACGTPVIAYGRGGVTESVQVGKTGVFFNEQTTESICDAVMRFERDQAEFDPVAIRAHAEKFNATRFREEFLKLVEDEWLTFNAVAGRRPSDDPLFLSPDLSQQALRLRGKVAAVDAEADAEQQKAFA
jgi:UDP-N-acetylmuramyl pentapeptide phosphotransferase/UDP-N-acetylglucosamine-1-phosphate transferase/glycosyltransferase involved in cell wall biosynthesis